MVVFFKKHIFLIALSILFFGCNIQNKNEKLFTLLNKEESGIDFFNEVTNTEKLNIFNYRNFYNGGGVGIGDINNDGLADVYFTSNMGQNKLYLNKGNFKFEDITNAAFNDSISRWSTGVVFVDINNDGWLDIYVCNAGYKSGVPPSDNLYINNKDLTFTEKAKEYGLDDNGYTTHAAFFDYDKDGDLDAYILNNSFIPVNTLNYSNKRELRAEDWDVKEFLKGGGDKLLRNDNGKFIDVSEQSGIYGSLIGFGLGISVSDLNNDGWLDIYISNDFFEKDYLYINDKDGSFTEQLEKRAGHISQSSMGSDIADINNDGYSDIFATDMLPDDDYRLKRTSSFDGIDVYMDKIQRGFYNQYVQNTLQLNDGKANFKDIAYNSGVYGSDWSWGALIFDCDNDGWNDLFVCNGIYKDVIDQDFIDFFADEIIQKMVTSGRKEKLEEVVNKMPSTPIPNKAYRNNRNLTFIDAASQWGLSQPSFSNGAAYGDLDNDGDLDLIVNNVNQPSFIYKNNTNNQKNYISISLKSIDKNKYAIGSKITVKTKGKTFVKEVMPSRGFQSSVDYKQVFGLDTITKIDTIKVLWFDGRQSIILNPKINSLVEISNENANIPTIKFETTDPYFKPSNQPFVKHIENTNYKDFHYERGIFEMLSKEGPATAIADLNKDGIEDIFIGASYGNRPQLYLSNYQGYNLDTTSILYSDFEDTAASFFDVDGDKDLDLFIGSGGNQFIPLTREMQDRIYLNDGNNKFKLSTDALPTNGMNTSVSLPLDYDQDGDWDLFVGSRSYPLSYGKSPMNYLYENNGKGKYKEVAQSYHPQLADAGFVTSATYENIDEVKDMELIIATYFGDVKVYKYINKIFVEVKTSFTGINGLWNHVSAFDFNNDGKKDLLFGNEGKNCYMTLYPLSLWIKDFDENGTIDKILTRKINNKNLPVMMKREFMEQLPSLKKKDNLRHEVYANKTIEEILGDRIKNSDKLEANEFKSMLWINEGHMKFHEVELPYETQLSSLKAVAYIDVNNDGYLDIIPAGNKDSYLPHFGRNDAFTGDVFLNDKGKKWNVINSVESGIDLKGEVKHILSIAKKRKVLVVKNNNYPKVYELNPNK